MKKAKILVFFLVLLAALPLILISYRVTSKLIANEQLKTNFINQDHSLYQQQVPLHKMPTDTLERYFSIATTLVATRVDNKMVVPNDIEYYQMVNNELVLKYVIPKGTLVKWTPTNLIQNDFAYGLLSLPTYKNELRYAKPFLLANDESNIKDLPLYYVYLKDIENATRSLIKHNDYFTAYRKRIFTTVDEMVFKLTRRADETLYLNGIYCSNNLSRNIWMTADTILLLLFLLIIIIEVFYFYKRKIATR